MCVICRDEVTYNEKRLDCSWCDAVTQIPNIPGLLELNCSYCPQLSQIPNIPGLLELYCGHCPQLSQIPCIEGLFYLNCRWCPTLTQIPCIKDLKKLNCDYCPMLTKIPEIEGLWELHCQGCRKLTELPYYYCSEYGMDVHSDGCVWLNHETNKKYNKNLKKLIFLQRWLRKMMIVKKLHRLIPRLMQIYYHPEAKGGYFHKKEMLGFIESIY